MDNVSLLHSARTQVLKLQDWYIYERPWCCNKNGCATATCDNETSSYFGDIASDIVQMVCRAPFGSAILVCDEYKISVYEAAWCTGQELTGKSSRWSTILIV